MRARAGTDERGSTVDRMDREEIRDRFAATAMLTGRYMTDRTVELVDALADEMVRPQADEEPEVFWRKVIVVEVITPLSPYEDGLEGLSGAIERQEVAAGIVTESTDRIEDPSVYPATWRSDSTPRSATSPADRSTAERPVRDVWTLLVTFANEPPKAENVTVHTSRADALATVREKCTYPGETGVPEDDDHHLIRYVRSHGFNVLLTMRTVWAGS